MLVVGMRGKQMIVGKKSEKGNERTDQCNYDID